MVRFGVVACNRKARRLSWQLSVDSCTTVSLKFRFPCAQCMAFINLICVVLGVNVVVERTNRFHIPNKYTLYRLYKYKVYCRGGCRVPSQPQFSLCSFDLLIHISAEAKTVTELFGGSCVSAGDSLIYTLEVQPSFFMGWFPNHHYFSRGLSSCKRNHHFLNGGWLPGYIYSHIYMRSFTCIWPNYNSSPA